MASAPLLTRFKFKLNKFKQSTFTYSALEKLYRTFYGVDCVYTFLRTNALITKVTGPLHLRSRLFIEIDITYRCNLACFNCNRSLGKGQAPSNEDMTIDQIRKFVQESIDGNIKWKRIRVLGGEPTLNPHLLEILSTLIEYKQTYSPHTLIELTSNGYGEKVQNTLLKIPKEVLVKNTSKESIVQYFHPINKAAKDSFMYRYANYTNGCYVTSTCGIGLTPHGYYPCGIAGSIDRVFGFDKGRKKLPLLEDTLFDQLQLFCSLCGRFRCGRLVTETVMSPTWKKAYEEYRNNRKKLSLY